jgi:hypothetical protein
MEGPEITTPTSYGSNGLEMTTSPRARQIRLPCRRVLPHKENLNFMGRVDVLSHVYSVLRPDKPDGNSNAQSVFVLCGLGGVGKTQIEIRLAMDYMDSFQVVLFAHADEPANLLNDFARFAIDLGLVDQEEPDYLYCCEQLKKWFEEAGM